MYLPPHFLAGPPVTTITTTIPTMAAQLLCVGGDVGGTNSRLALYAVPAAQLHLHEGKQ